MRLGSLWDAIRDAVRPGTSTARLVNIVFIPVLAILVLLLPPFSVLGRISGGGTGGQITLGPAGGSSSVEGLVIEVRPNVLDADVVVKVQKQATDQKGQTLPQGVSAASSVYKMTWAKAVDVPFAVEVALAEPARSGENLDFFVKEGEVWQWAAGATVSDDGGKAKASLRKPASALMVGRIPEQQPAVAGWIAPKAGLDSVARETLSALNPLWHTLNADGSLAGPLSDVPKGNYRISPSIQNLVDGAFKGEVVNAVLRSDEVRKRHVANIAGLAKQNAYGGVDINYQDIDPVLRDKFTSFVGELAEALHQEKRTLSVVLPLPEKNSRGWETGAYDWYALGKAADYVVISTPRDQSAYHSLVPSVLSFATTQIDRRKLNMAVSTFGHEKSKAGVKDLTTAEALALATKLDIKGTPAFLPGETITFYAPNLLKDAGASGIQWNNDTKTVSFSYPAGDEVRTVWIENTFSIAFKLQYARKYNIRGVSVQNLDDTATDQSVSTLLKAFKANGSVQLAEPSGQSLTISWQSSDGSLSASGAGWVNWTVPNNPGAKFTVSMVVGDGITSTTSAKSLTVAALPTPTPTPLPKPTATPAPPTPVPTQQVSAPAVPPTPTTAPVIVAPPPGGTKYPGVGYGMQLDAGNNLPKALQMTRAAGFDWAKIQIRWDAVESSRGNINWGYIDTIVNQAAAGGVRVMFSVVAAPRWSTPADYTDVGPPSNPQDFANFVGAIASRHAGKVHAYEIWNEQNVYHEWGGKGRRINAVKYIELLSAGYNAVKAADPNAVIVSGGLTPTGFNDGDTAYDDVVYMEMMYQAGLKDYTDAIGVHGNVVMPYGPDLAASANGDHGSFYFRRFEQLREVMERNGDSGKQIWFTEFGWPSSSQNLWRFPRAVEISESQQSDWLVKSFAVAKASGYVGPMFLWNLNFAPGADPADEWGKAAFSVLRRDWSPRQSYNALAAMPK